MRNVKRAIRPMRRERLKRCLVGLIGTVLKQKRGWSWKKNKNLKKRRRNQKRRKPELNPEKNLLSEIGLVAKAPKARRKAGLIAMLPTVMVDTNHVVDQEKKSERSIPHADQPQAHVKSEEEESLGAKNQRNKEKRNELNISKT